ncbi:MAG: hypothetical protein ABI740_07460, partial [Alphaproteobacteria bacterium]
MQRLKITTPALFALAFAGCAGGTPTSEGLPDKSVKSALSDEAQASDIAVLRWIAKGSDRVAFLTTQPVECIKSTSDATLAHRRDLGRIAFDSPALLGGAAGRKGLACGSCHLDGRGNVDLFIEGVSGDPGTADVTSSLFSKTRGDGEFNPKPIPDLAAKDGKQIKDRRGAEFRVKVHGLVADEFDGQEPPAPVFEDLLVYLDALDIAACSNPAARVTLRPQRDLDAVGMALIGAREATDPAETEFWIRVARRRLEKIDERYLAPDLTPVRARIGRLSAALGAEADAIHASKAPTPPITAEGWAALVKAVADGEPKSLYDPAVLKAGLIAST